MIQKTLKRTKYPEFGQIIPQALFHGLAADLFPPIGIVGEIVGEPAVKKHKGIDTQFGTFLDQIIQPGLFDESHPGDNSDPRPGISFNQLGLQFQNRPLPGYPATEMSARTICEFNRIAGFPAQGLQNMARFKIIEYRMVI